MKNQDFVRLAKLQFPLIPLTMRIVSRTMTVTKCLGNQVQRPREKLARITYVSRVSKDFTLLRV